MRCCIAGNYKGYLVMVKQNKKPAKAATTTNPTAGMVAMPAATAANKGAAIAWAKAQGLPSFSALVIGNGPNPTNVPNPHTTARRYWPITQWPAKPWPHITRRPKLMLVAPLHQTTR